MFVGTMKRWSYFLIAMLAAQPIHGQAREQPNGIWANDNVDLPSRQAGSPAGIPTGSPAGSPTGSRPANADNFDYTGLLTNLTKIMTDQLQSLRNDTQFMATKVNKSSADVKSMLAKLGNLDTSLFLATSGEANCPRDSFFDLPGRRFPLVGTLRSNERLYAGEKFCSNSGQTCLAIGRNGHGMVLYNTVSHQILWSMTREEGDIGSCDFIHMEPNGCGSLLYIYRGANFAPWWQWGQRCGRELTFTQDGHLCFGEGGRCTWDSKTNKQT